MSDLEKGREGLNTPSGDSDSEAAAAKLWAVYVSEAEKYDKALVESWKSDMNGMLIFAGLFSASLTAFLIESYKTLSPDSGNATVQLLEQISLQLAANSNGSTFSVAPPTLFTPSPAALICNALWFISLGLSLSAALIATLLDQWARNFLHHSEMRSAPVIRARVFSFLYYGLKRFNMHAVVEAIPLLLHASLLLFLAGLVTFLLPVNQIIMGIAAGLLALLVIVYCGLTILPILYLDCPYRTPVSGALWRLLNTLRPTLRPAAANDRTPTVVEAVVESATGISDERTDRDRRALIWTVKSLTDDTELEPFIESIPDVLWGPNGRRVLYDDHIRTLINNPDTYLMARISRLLQSAASGLLLPEAKTRRQITCLKALWTIAPCWTHLKPDVPFLPSYGDPTVEYYAVSARCQLRCNAFRLIDHRMEEILADLSRFQMDLLCGRLPSLAGTVQSLVVLESMSTSYLSLSPWYPRLSCFDDNFNRSSQPPTDIPGLHLFLVNAEASIQHFRAEASRMILLSYFDDVARLKGPPFELQRTQDTVRSLPAFRLSNPVSPHVSLSWCTTFNKITGQYVGTEDSDAARGWTESILETLLSLWGPDTNGKIILPRGLINCLNSKSAPQMYLLLNRDSNFALKFLSAITARLSESHDLYKHDCLTALWYYLQLRYSHASLLDTGMWERALTAVLGLPSSPASQSVAALLKQRVLLSALLVFDRIPRSKRDILAYFAHPLLPPKMAVKLLPSLTADVDSDTILSEDEYRQCQKILSQRIEEAQFMNLTAFLAICNTSEGLPFNAAETLEHISFQPTNPIDANHQIQFVNAVQAAVERNPSGEFMRGIVQSQLFIVYDDNDHRLPWIGHAIRWLDAPSALQMIRESFAVYTENFPIEGYSRERVQAILRSTADAAN
ncbi:hypothetical protein C8J57DRAFT_1468283 [Mycena rebaudengoi]|nr:hypothetical protein C8J57DRAFT_1468283 [Mycena rebaudengoi]